MSSLVIINTSRFSPDSSQKYWNICPVYHQSSRSRRRERVRSVIANMLWTIFRFAYMFCFRPHRSPASGQHLYNKGDVTNMFPSTLRPCYFHSGIAHTHYIHIRYLDHATHTSSIRPNRCCLLRCLEDPPSYNRQKSVGWYSWTTTRVACEG